MVAGSVANGGWTWKMDRADLALWLVKEAEKGSHGLEWVGKFPALYPAPGKEDL